VRQQVHNTFLVLLCHIFFVVDLLCIFDAEGTSIDFSKKLSTALSTAPEVTLFKKHFLISI
jgi:hypothetical protein